jgi:hypothetical protein
MNKEGSILVTFDSAVVITTSLFLKGEKLPNLAMDFAYFSK